MHASICLNCEKEIAKQQHFCANCGQQSTIHRFTIAHFFHEAFHAFTHADKGMIYLLKELAIRPGIVAREYIAGKRKKYYNPFTFFLMLAAIFVFSKGLTSRKEEVKRELPQEIKQIQNAEQREKATAMYERAMKVRDFTTKGGNILAMIAVPFFAGCFWLIFYRKPYHYAEHLVANLMFVSFANLAFSLLVFPLQAVLKGAPWIPMLGFLLQWSYLVIAYKSFLQLKGFVAAVKVTFATLLSLLLWILLSTTAMAFYVYQNAHFYEYFSRMAR